MPDLPGSAGRLLQRRARAFPVRARRVQGCTGLRWSLRRCKSPEFRDPCRSSRSGAPWIRANLPEAMERPIWKIDMGRGTQVTYIVGGSSEGRYNLELSSLEQEKLVRASVAIDQPIPADQASINLREAIDALANADLVRNRAKSALPGLDAVKSYDQALALATRLDDKPLMRLILTQKARFLIFRQNKFE